MATTIPALSVCVGTIRRPYCIQRLVRGVRARFPDLPIIVGDQNAPDYPMDRFYAEHGVARIRVGLDAGVGVARQAAVNAATTEFVLVCDDDFVFGDDTDPSIPINILRADREVDIVGGLVRDIDSLAPQFWSARRWERFLIRDAKRGILYSTMIDLLTPLRREVNGVPYFFCDAVLNWKVLRRNVFERGAGWDARFKCNGEHEDFYLNIKENTSLKVAYCPRFHVYHHPPADFGYAKQREAQEGWQEFAKKWGLTESIEMLHGAEGAIARIIFAREYKHMPEGETIDPELLRNESCHEFGSRIFRSPA